MRFEQFNSGDAGPTASSQQHAQAFPYCGRYLINWMNAGILKGKVPQRWRAFVKWCGSEARAVEACTWGQGPLVQINSQMVGRANGRYKHGDTVFIHGKVANKYEQGDGWVIWESTVLHEMIHWARHQEGLKDGNVEVGQEFEMEAYGEHIELTTQWRRGP
jgi:Metallopeptidase toxin 3